VPLAVTVVTGIRGHAKTRVLTAMGYAAGVEEIESEADDDFCLELAERLVAAAEDGEVGRTAVELPVDVDPVEVALVLPRLFGESRGAVSLDEIVTVVTATDVRALLFRDGKTGGGSSVGLSEQLALQLEFATAIVVVDAHLVDEAGLREIQAEPGRPPAGARTRRTSPAARRRTPACASGCPRPHLRVDARTLRGRPPHDGARDRMRGLP
jgi:hypothetical protein